MKKETAYKIAANIYRKEAPDGYKFFVIINNNRRDFDDEDNHREPLEILIPEEQAKDLLQMMQTRQAKAQGDTDTFVEAPLIPQLRRASAAANLPVASSPYASPPATAAKPAATGLTKPELGTLRSSARTYLKEAAQYVAQTNTDKKRVRAGYARIFSDAMLKHWLEEISTQSVDSELRDRNAAIAQKLLEREKYRTLRKISQPKINAIKNLHNKHPHFKAVIEFVLQRLRMAEVTAKPLRLPPILLHGFPGLGKTHFCNDLAAALGTHLRRLPYDTEQTSAALLGSDKKWSTSACGALFDELVQGQYANPVFLLDEIDKARIHQNDNPLASLHSLLEPVSAASVRDISVEFTFDASHVIWIAAGNDIGALPDSLRSRFEIFMIKPPLGKDALKLAHNIVKEQLASMAAAEMQPPGFRQIMRMAHLTPRELIRALEAAYASAIHAGRKHLLDTDIPAWAWLVDEDEHSTDSGDDPISRPHGVTVH